MSILRHSSETTLRVVSVRCSNIEDTRCQQLPISSCQQCIDDTPLCITIQHLHPRVTSKMQLLGCRCWVTRVPRCTHLETRVTVRTGCTRRMLHAACIRVLPSDTTSRVGSIRCSIVATLVLVTNGYRYMYRWTTGIEYIDVDTVLSTVSDVYM